MVRGSWSRLHTKTPVALSWNTRVNGSFSKTLSCFFWSMSLGPRMPQQHLVALVGAGPAGIYGARKLAEAGHRVVLLNRDIKPGGLAEYGIFVDKEKMKTGLRKQFKRILADPKVFYFGHVNVGRDKAVTLEDLKN